MEPHYIVHHGLLNVSLGAMRRDYIELAMRGLNNPVLTAGTLIKVPMTLEAELGWYDKVAHNKESDVLFAILAHVYDGTGALTDYRYIGHTGLHGISYPSGYATSGSIIVDDSLLQKGYGTEAKLLLLYNAFRYRGLRKVNSMVKGFNGRSLGHLLACGYEIVGSRRDQHFQDGDLVDEILLDVFRERWEYIWRRYQSTKTLPRLTKRQRALVTKTCGPP